MPTALELPREEWGRYINSAKRRPDLPGPTAEELQEREALLARIRKAAAELKRQFSVRKVVLFGSLAHSAWFTPGSDVDLAVEGLERYGADNPSMHIISFRSWNQLAVLISPVPISKRTWMMRFGSWKTTRSIPFISKA